jgi:hypothetical protein
MQDIVNSMVHELAVSWMRLVWGMVKIDNMHDAYEDAQAEAVNCCVFICNLKDKMTAWSLTSLLLPSWNPSS